jgi:hypothetical protein
MVVPEDEMFDKRQIVYVIPEPESGPSLFDVTPKLPAGEVGTEPQFVLYLGINTGPYQSSPNGTLILPPVPIEWIVGPLNVTAGQCPSRHDNLVLFGVINCLVMFLTIFTGHRPLLKYLTRGFLGNPSRYSFLWTWIISFGFQIASNAVISRLVVQTPGYEHLNMLNVFALYSARPRVNQIWMGTLRFLFGPYNTKDVTGEWVYTDSYVATSISEFFLQLVSAIFVGVTWKRFPNKPILDHMNLYVNFLIVSPILGLLGWAFVPIWYARDEGITTKGSIRTHFFGWLYLLVGLTGFFTFGAAWLYWSHFLELPGSL